ncbi:MAG: glutamate racemase [Candidatus Moranbacteria bacterium]|nr:glutamate racemase [Candidatus Moranbacteria bacterium]
MIGIFDSGFGGLTILKAVEKALPQYSYLYLGDNKRAPYGCRSDAEIYRYTLEGVEALFARGARLVILACNTSSAVALRKIQQEVLPFRYPHKRVLGIIIPTAEESDTFSQTKHIGVWATEATVQSGVYEREMLKIDPKLRITTLPCPLLVPLIEAGSKSSDAIKEAINVYIEALFERDTAIDTLILGCTHYPIIEDEIKSLLPTHVRVIAQGDIIAKKLAAYLERHADMETALSIQMDRVFLTTSADEEVKRIADSFYGERVGLEMVVL